MGKCMFLTVKNIRAGNNVSGIETMCTCFHGSCNEIAMVGYRIVSSSVQWYLLSVSINLASGSECGD